MAFRPKRAAKNWHITNFMKEAKSRWLQVCIPYRQYADIKGNDAHDDDDDNDRIFDFLNRF